MIFSLIFNSFINILFYIININCTNTNDINFNDNNNISFSLFCKVPNDIIAISKCFKNIQNTLGIIYDHSNCKIKEDNNVLETLNSLTNDFSLLHKCLLKVANFVSETPYEKIRQSDIKIIEEYFINYLGIIGKIIVMVRNHYVDHYTSLPDFNPKYEHIILQSDFNNTQFKVLHDIFVFINSLLKINMRGKFKYLSSNSFKRYHMRYYKVLKYLYDRKDII